MRSASGKTASWSAVVRLDGDVETSGGKLEAPPSLLALFDDFLRWEPFRPRDAKELAEVSARLCRLLRDEVTEQLATGSESPGAPGGRLAQAALSRRNRRTVRRRLRAGRHLRPADGAGPRHPPHAAASTGRRRQLAQTNSLIGTALRLLTDDGREPGRRSKTSLGTLTRVLDAVHWRRISKGDPDAWLYFYEDFLEVYDNALRKQTGSYYTPPEVVGAMVRLVDEVAAQPRPLRPSAGLGVAPTSRWPIRRSAPARSCWAICGGSRRRLRPTKARARCRRRSTPRSTRLIAFEMQLGPFAVAQLRMLAEIAALTGTVPRQSPPPDVRHRHAGQSHTSRRNGFRTRTPRSPSPGARRTKIKKHEPITVVIGQPALQGEGEGLRRLDRGRERATPSPTLRLDAAARVGRRRPRQASAQPLRVLLALGDVEGLRPLTPTARHRHRLLHHRGGLPERAGLPEDARLSAPELPTRSG